MIVKQWCKRNIPSKVEWDTDNKYSTYSIKSY